MSKKLIIGAIIGLILLGKSGNSTTQKRQALIQRGFPSDLIGRMTNAEIDDVYLLMFRYGGQGNTIPPGALRDRLSRIGEKYNIFT